MCIDELRLVCKNKQRRMIMKNSVKRVLALALSLVLTLGLLAGCGNSGTTPGGEAPAPPLTPLPWHSPWLRRLS